MKFYVILQTYCNNATICLTAIYITVLFSVLYGISYSVTPTESRKKGIHQYPFFIIIMLLIFHNYSHAIGFCTCLQPLMKFFCVGGVHFFIAFNHA